MDANNLEVFKAKMASGKLCLGMVVSLADPSVSEIAAEAGYDFSWIDLEHSAMNIETALGHVMAARGTGMAPFVRVPGNDPFIIKPLLELAPAAVIIPMVNSAAEAEAAVAACRYPPRGVRGCGPKRGWRFGATPFRDYLRTSEAEPLVIVQIEHIAALGELDAILAVKGLGSICVGPCDLAGSMGLLGETGHPEVERVIDEIAAKTRAAGIPLGTASDNPAKWYDRGARWMAVGGDCGALLADSRRAIENANAALQGRGI